MGISFFFLKINKCLLKSIPLLKGDILGFVPFSIFRGKWNVYMHVCMWVYVWICVLVHVETHG